MKLKQKINNLFGGVVLAQGVTNSPLFKSIGDTLFGVRPGTAGTSPATAQNVGELITQVLQILLLVAGSLAVVFLVVGGIKYVLSRGNEESAESAKKTMTAAIWGLVIIVMAYAIVYIISSALIEGEGALGL